MVNAIENIDNKSIKSNILHSIEKETIIYDRNIKPRVSNERLRELMNSLLSSSERRILPSELKEQFDTCIYEQVKTEIPTIDNEIIRGNIEYFYENKSFYIPERLLEEINIYNQDIKPRLSNMSLR
jgi:hypothetical protein